MPGFNLIPTEKIIERFRYENPWWLTRQLSEIYKIMAKRLYFDLFFPFVKEKSIRRALVLMGPRRVGKTVMLFHSIQQLLEENIHPHKFFLLASIIQFMFICTSIPLYL
ncbi:hypothetical protein [Mongoliitalea daihaiensis]|uniref:hypothetical protein n=1 Tax=Mongoliitalea daihaiensis TaxID=2782006 RepID=UPI001F23C256|nr:hypothetical protein [Mongoliitalea daihaiensis]